MLTNPLLPSFSYNLDTSFLLATLFPLTRFYREFCSSPCTQLLNQKSVHQLLCLFYCWTKIFDKSGDNAFPVFLSLPFSPCISFSYKHCINLLPYFKNVCKRNPIHFRSFPSQVWSMPVKPKSDFSMTGDGSDNSETLKLLFHQRH